MSSLPGRSSFDPDGFGFKKALLVVGFMCCFLVILLLMRFGCNIAIDLCVMCSPREARRTAAEFRNMICCCFYKLRGVAPTTDVEMGGTGGGDGMEVNQNNNHNNRSRPSPVVQMLEQYSEEKRSLVLATVLTGETVNEEHLKEWHQKHRHQHTVSSFEDYVDTDLKSGTDDGTTTMMTPATTTQCSICLHDIEIGHVVHVGSTCKHVFHRDCLLEWCSRSYQSGTTTTSTINDNNNPTTTTTQASNTESNMFLSCPYCRQSIVSESQVLEAIQDCNKNNTKTTSTTTASSKNGHHNDEEPTAEA